MKILDKRENILHRYTLRGLKKCPICGHYNGMRALRCKNKSCTRAVGSDKMRPQTKKLIALDTVQLVTMTDTKLYSVQVREKDHNERNFVQITDKTISTDVDGYIISRNAICYVDTCKYDSHEVNISCKHVKNAADTMMNQSTATMATVLIINISVWYSMNMNEDAKSRIWKLYSNFEHTIPIVQRINKYVFVVKCDASIVCPAGRVHIQLTGGSSGNVGVQPKYMCGCKNQKSLELTTIDGSLQIERCEHLYLLVAAILSNDSIKEEFQEHVKSVFNDMIIENEYLLEESLLVTEDFIRFSENILNDVDLSNDDFNSNFCENDHTVDLEKVISTINHSSDNDKNTHPNNGLNSLGYVTTSNECNGNDLKHLDLINCKIEFMDELKLSNGNFICIDQISPIVSNQITTNNNQQPLETVTPVKKSKLEKSRLTQYQRIQNTVNDRIDIFDHGIGGMEQLSFIMWLNSIIERINLTMDYNNNGQPEPLIFSVHHNFFEKLRNRFSIGMKLRLPNRTTIIARGKYKGLTMFTWNFTAIDIVQKMFTTNTIALQAERIFIEKRNGLFKSFDFLNGQDSLIRSCNEKSLTKLTKYKTYLKVGERWRTSQFLQIKNSTTDDSIGAESFTIDWIPGVLKISKFGEMRITFKFGHLKI